MWDKRAGREESRLWRVSGPLWGTWRKGSETMKGLRRGSGKDTLWSCNSKLMEQRLKPQAPQTVCWMRGTSYHSHSIHGYSALFNLTWYCNWVITRQQLSANLAPLFSGCRRVTLENSRQSSRLARRYLAVAMAWFISGRMPCKNWRVQATRYCRIWATSTSGRLLR